MRDIARSMDTVRKLVPIVISSTEGKQKKKKKRKHSTNQSESRANPQTAWFSFETPPVFLATRGRPGGHLPAITPCSTRDGQSGSTGHKSKKKSKSSASTKDYSANKAVYQRKATGLSGHSRETVRWEGTLEDPLAEEERIELYKADRRQRYLAHRQALLQNTQKTLVQPFSNGDKDAASPVA